MPDLAELVTQLLNGVVLGLLYAIIALGFMLILGTMEVINFSHGVLFALGGYSALALGPMWAGGARSCWRPSSWVASASFSSSASAAPTGGIRSSASSSPSARRWRSRRSSAS